MTIERINIVFLIPNLNVGGAERVFLNLMNNLDRAHYKVVLVCERFDGGYAALLKKDIVTYEMKARNKLIQAFTLIGIISKLKPQFVYSTLGSSVTACIASSFTVSSTIFISRIGNTLSAFLSDVRSNSILRFWRLYVSSLFVLLRSDVIVCQSEHMKKDILETFTIPKSRREKLTVIRNPIILKQTANRTCDKHPNASATREGVRLRFLCVGRLHSQKNIPFLVEAFGIFYVRHPNAVLDILGDGPERRRVKEVTESLGLVSAVRFHGSVENCLPYYQSADVFLTSARYEGVSNAMLEAISCNLPIVSLNCPSGVGDLVRPMENGVLVKPQASPFEYAHAMENALKLIGTQTMAQVNNRICEQYQLSRVLGEYDKLFSMRG